MMYSPKSWSSFLSSCDFWMITVVWCHENLPFLPQESLYLSKVKVWYEWVTGTPSRTYSGTSSSLQNRLMNYFILASKYLVDTVYVGKHNPIIYYHYFYSLNFLVMTMMYHKELEFCITKSFSSVHCSIFLHFSSQLQCRPL